MNSLNRCCGLAIIGVRGCAEYKHSCGVVASDGATIYTPPCDTPHHLICSDINNPSNSSYNTPTQYNPHTPFSSHHISLLHLLRILDCGLSISRRASSWRMWYSCEIGAFDELATDGTHRLRALWGGRYSPWKELSAAAVQFIITSPQPRLISYRCKR